MKDRIVRDVRVGMLVGLAVAVSHAGAQTSEVQDRLTSQAERIEALEDGYHRLRDDLDAADAIVAGWDRGFYLGSADGHFRMNIGGWIQPRYIYRMVGGEEDTSSFTMRRVRLDIRGHVFVPELSYRVMSEHARSSNLRDAWIDYAFSPELQLRAGQFTVPFQWHRYVGPRRQHFPERGVPGEAFGFSSGRDLGVMAHGRLAESKLAYGVGFFDGAGRNVDISNSSGNMTSARLTWAVLGALPREESDYAMSERVHLSFGGGAQGAWRSELRDWSLGRSAAEDERADWVSGTMDTRIAWQGASLVAEGYLRHVDPEANDVDAYEGWAGMISAGYFVVPRRVELVGRGARLRLDRDDRETQRDEWGAGVNFYHRGHDWKTRLAYLADTDRSGEQSRSAVVEWHMQF